MARHVRGEVQDAMGMENAGAEPPWLARKAIQPVGERMPSVAGGLLVYRFKRLQRTHTN